MAFYVGQKVVCVDDEVQEADLKQRIRRGEIYTVAKFYPHGSPKGVTLRYRRGCPCVDLCGIIRTDDTPYAAARFRPVVERPTDISIFKAMLTPKTAEIDA
jgi:hypothetical protein